MAYAKAYYRTHSAYFKKKAVAWYRANREHVNALARARYKYNSRKAKSYYKNNAEAVKARSAEWAKKNPDKRRAMKAKRRTAKTKAGGAYTSAQWIALCNKHHNRCVRCGKKRKLTSDHVVPVSKGGSSNISNIQPLCLPCNSHKGTKTTDYR